MNGEYALMKPTAIPVILIQSTRIRMVRMKKDIRDRRLYNREYPVTIPVILIQQPQEAARKPGGFCF